MHSGLAALLAVALLPAAPAPASAMPEEPRVVTREEYAQVARGMTRVKVERLFGAGSGCVYIKYQLDNVLVIGRQYRNTAGTTVSIEYERPGDGGRARVTGKRWGFLESCFDDERAPAEGTVIARTATGSPRST